MFKKVINTTGFWKSVFFMAFAFMVVFTLIKWGIEGFEADYFSTMNVPVFLFTLISAGFVYGFFVTYGKFLSKLRNNDPKK